MQQQSGLGAAYNLTKSYLYTTNNSFLVNSTAANNLNLTGLVNITNSTYANSTNFWIYMNSSINPANAPLSSLFTIGRFAGTNEVNISNIFFSNSTSGFIGINTSFHKIP